MIRSELFTDHHGAARRARLAAMQKGGKPRRRFIRRIVVVAVVLFALVNVLAAANPWLHRNNVQTACTGNMS